MNENCPADVTEINITQLNIKRKICRLNRVRLLTITDISFEHQYVNVTF